MDSENPHFSASWYLQIEILQDPQPLKPGKAYWLFNQNDNCEELLKLTLLEEKTKN